MRRLLSLCLLLAGLCSHAQREPLSRQLLRQSPPSRLPQASARAAINSSVIDTLQYPYEKELRLNNGEDSFFVDAMVGNVRTAAQGYENPGSISIKGVKFWGGAYTFDPAYEQEMEVEVSVWSVDAQFMPVTQLASATVPVRSGTDFYVATFATPLQHSGNYSVAVRSVPNDTLQVVLNNAGNEWTRNYGEGLAWRRFGSGTLNTALSFFGQDMEYMIFPIVEYTPTAGFSTDGSATPGVTESFPNSSSPFLMHRMFNLNAFDKFWDLVATDATFTWDYGTGSPQKTLNGAYNYTTGGTYNVTLTAALAGYSRSLTLTHSETVTVSATLSTGALGLSDLCSGSAFSVPYTVAGLVGAGNVFTVQLSDASGSFASPVTIGSQAGTATSGSIPATIPTQTTAGTGYRVRVLASDPALTGSDNGSNLEVRATPASSLVYEGSPFCLASGTATPTLGDATGGTFSADPGVVIDPATGVIDLAASTPGTYQVVYGNGNGCGDPSAHIAIRPASYLAPVPNVVRCAGTGTGFLYSEGAPGQTYTWTNSNTAIGLTASGTGNQISFTTSNNGDTPIDGFISIRATGGTGCDDVKRVVTFRVTVNPVPVLTAPPMQLLCAGDMSTPVVFNSTVPGTTVTWTNNNPGIGLGPVGTGDIPSFMARNPTGFQEFALVLARPTANRCAGALTPVFFRVNPSAGTIAYGGTPYCGSGVAVPARTGSPNGTFSAAPAGLILNASTGEVNLARSQPGTYTVTYSINGAGGCAVSATAPLTILPAATVNAVPNQVYCDGTTTTPIAFSGTAAGYSWTNSTPAIGLASAGTGAALPAFNTQNTTGAPLYASIRVQPLGDGSSTCTGKAIAFRITVNDCVSGARAANVLAVSPNPASGRITVQLGADATYSLFLSDRFGQPAGGVRTVTGSSTSLDLGALLPGTYVLQATNVRTGERRQVQVVKL